MKNQYLICTLISIVCLAYGPIHAQFESNDSAISVDETLRYNNNSQLPCGTDETYRIIEQRCKENLMQFEKHKMQPTGIVSLEWPLRASDSLKDCSYYRVSAYVDQNTASGVFQDFNCSSNTYDGHRGTDISIWPFNYLKMDNNQVAVVAAAPGVILDKHDGEFDKNCATNTMMPNYIVVRHADGSRALYLHMKKNSLTNKAIGESVAVGEFIGVVGSSGNSSGPHLHFEVWAGATVDTRIDPFKGSCNSLNANSWWTKQKDYKETAIVKVSTNSTDIVIPACPATEIPNEQTVFQIPFQGTGLPAGFAKFYIFLRDEISGLVADISILNPDGTLFTNWTYTSSMDTKTRIQGWSKKLPTNPGIYTFKASYNGKVCTSQFEITLPVKTNSEIKFSGFKLYPNPNNGQIFIQLENIHQSTIDVYNLLGSKIYSTALNQNLNVLNVQANNGIYYYRFYDNQNQQLTGKFTIER